MDWGYEKYAYSNTSLKVWLMVETAAVVLFFECFCMYLQRILLVSCIMHYPGTLVTINDTFTINTSVIPSYFD